MSTPAPAPGLWRRYVVAPLVAQLTQGVAPRELALTLALGATLGIFPILGATTTLCALAAIALRLNQPVIQVVNYLLTPLHVLLLIPFYRAGEWLFRAPPVPITDVAQLIARFRAGPWQFILDYGKVGAFGIVAWSTVAPLLALAVYALSLPLLSRMAAALDARRG